MIIKSVGVLSLGRIVASIYGGLGLIVGAIFAGVSLLGFAPIAEGVGPPEAIWSTLLGGGAVVFLPLLYGAFGFIVGLVVGTIYNFVAKIVGGLELQAD